MSARQITDARAPFPDIDSAIDVGMEHLRQQAAGGSPIGVVAEEQPGGYYARIAWLQPIGRGGRKGRKRNQQHTAEVGKIDGPWLQPLNDTTLSGKPYFSSIGPFGEEEWEPVGAAQARLVKAHQAKGEAK